MDNSQIVLIAFIQAFKSEENTVLDLMELVTADKVGLRDEEFSEALYKLQSDGKISNVLFEDNDPKKVLLWDDIEIHTSNFKSI